MSFDFVCARMAGAATYAQPHGGCGGRAMPARKNPTALPNSTGGYRIRPYANQNLAPKGSVFFLCGVLRGDSPQAVTARLRSNQSPSGALKRTSVPALLDGGARCAPPSGRLGSSGTFLLLFWSQKSRNKWVEALYKRVSPQGGDTRWKTAAATISNSSR